LTVAIIAPICAVLIAACGGSSVPPPPKVIAEVSSTPGQPSTVKGTSGRGASLRIGQSASFAGDQIVGSGKGEQVSVTVQRVVDQSATGVRYLGQRAPALPRGQRRVAVELTFRSTGKAAYDDSPEDELSLIGTDSGRPVGMVLPGITGRGQCQSDVSTSVDVPPRGIDPGCVFFQVPSDQKISAVRYQTQGGHYLATWAVH
jgi:hypothetical protein